MLGGVRRKHVLLGSISVTCVLLLLVITTKPPSTNPITQLNEVVFAERKVSSHDYGIVGDGGIAVIEQAPLNAAPNPGPTTPTLTKQEREQLVKQGIYLADNTQDDKPLLHHAPIQGAVPLQDAMQQQEPDQAQLANQDQQKQDAIQVEAQQKQDAVQDQVQQKMEEVNQRQQEMDIEVKRQQLQERHLQEQQQLQAKLREEEERERQEAEQRRQEEANPPPKYSQSSSGSVVSKTYRVNPKIMTVGERENAFGGRLTGRRMTYDGLFKMGENWLRHNVRREFLNSAPDTAFKPGDPVPPSQIRRVIILSTWRSGSSFLGDLLKSYPGTYFSFEPLHHLLKNQHLQEGPLVDVVLDLLRSIMTCDFSHQDEYVHYMRNNTFLIDHNTRVWNSCARNRALCFDKNYLSAACKYLPVNVMKTVRMGLTPVVTLLEDPALDLRVVHLVRDPRGALHSRMQLNWCRSLACSDPTTVCHDLMTDLKLSDFVRQRFPDRYLLVRYEDLGLEPELTARQIFEFLGLTYHSSVASFVREHTSLKRRTKKKPGAYSTYRDSKSTTFAWREALNYTALEEIQSVCREPLDYLRLRVFETEDEYTNYTLPVLIE